MQKISISFLFLVLLLPGVYAQKSGDFGFLGGTTYYVGDLNPAMPFRMTKPAFGILYRQNFNSRVSARIHAIRGKIAADDAISKANLDRNLNFESALTEGGLQFEINFFDYYIGSKQHRISPYLFGGAAVFLFNPQSLTTGASLPELKTEGQANPYKTYAFSMPFGLGMKYSVTDKIGIGAEWGIRKTSTDYLDDVSTTYAAPDPKAGMQRGNSRDTDWYSFAGVSVTVKIKMLSKERCLDHQREGY